MICSSCAARLALYCRKAVLFAGTIRENLLWGNENATEEELKEAIHAAQADEVVFDGKGGLDAVVEQEGRNFSGGQKQRLTIARALVRHPEILILDDSASALDFATDAKLRKAIRELSGEMTVFIVSQRASTIQYADQILVLDDGEIAGCGTHEELLEHCECLPGNILFSVSEGGCRMKKQTGQKEIMKKVLDYIRPQWLLVMLSLLMAVSFCGADACIFQY